MRRALPSDPARWLAALSLALAGCWHAARDGAPPPSSSPDPSGKPEPLVGPGRILPDVGATSNVVDVLPDGTRRLIVSGMRVVDHPDGSIERAREVLPNGTARVLSLPSRIGGGLVVYIVASNGTQLWRAKTWLDRLEPLAELWGPVDEMVAGFDRLYVRLTSGEIRAIDPDSGKQLSLGPLPPATRIRTLAFADAWRAVAVVDFRGALATFDAGNTWRPVPLDGVNVNQVGVKDGDFALDTPRGRFLLSAGGDLSRDDAPREGPQAPAGGNDTSAKVEGPASARSFGRRPLRAAIEDGWPLAGPGGEPAAVFAHAGAIHRVGLETGRLFETRSGAFRDDDGSCHAVPLRSRFGFICTTATGGSAIYAVEPPLEMREVARFARPRVVVASGNGGFVVRGPCARDAASTDAPAGGPAAAPSNTNAGGPAAESMPFCFFFPSGEEKQVSPPAGASEANADLRPVALRDGRALFVSSSAAGGKLFVARGAGFDAVPLSDRNGVLRRGYLLEGIEERAPGILGGWALVSEEIRGVRIGIDGKAEIGPASAKVDRTVVAGRFGFDWAASGRGFETVDGGMSWTPVDLAVPDPAVVPRSVASCGPVGCVRDKWLRVGWGRASEAPDLPLARTPERSRVSLAPARGVSFRCQPTGEVAGPPPSPPPKLVEAPAKKAQPVAVPPGPSGLRVFPRGSLIPLAPPIARPAPDPRNPSSAGGVAWSPFRGMPAPSLATGSVGLEAGTDPPMVMQARVYTWGPRGAEWLHTGYVQARFDDRFEFLGIRTTAATAPPWSDEDRASDALGLTAGQPVTWSALLDPSGRAAVLVAQRGAGRADLYGAAAGEPLLLWRDADNGALPAPNSVVRIGPTWFFLHSLWTSNAWSTTVYRVDAGVARRLARLPRVPVPPGEFAPKLMRRAQSKGLGLLVQGAPGFDQVIRDWYVLPIDPDSGDLEEPVRLYGSDLEGLVPERCSDERDGWMVNTELTYAPSAQVLSPVAPNLSSFELRLRLDPGAVCVDAIAARTEASPVSAGSPFLPVSEAAVIPMAATETSSGRKWFLRCSP